MLPKKILVVDKICLRTCPRCFQKKYWSWTTSVFVPVHDASKKNTGRGQHPFSYLSTMLPKKILVVDKIRFHTCPRCFQKKYWSWTKSIFNLVHDASKKKLVVDNMCPWVVVFLENLWTKIFPVSEIPHFCERKFDCLLCKMPLNPFVNAFH